MRTNKSKLKHRVEFILWSVCHRIHQTHTQTSPDRVHRGIPSLWRWSCFSIAGLLVWHCGPNSSEILHEPGLLKLLLAWPIGAKQDLTVTLMTECLRTGKCVVGWGWSAETSDHHGPSSPSGFPTTNIHPPPTTPLSLYVLWTLWISCRMRQIQLWYGHAKPQIHTDMETDRKTNRIFYTNKCWQMDAQKSRWINLHLWINKHKKYKLFLCLHWLAIHLFCLFIYWHTSFGIGNKSFIFFF